MGSQTSIYLIRHGIAAERGTYADDDERPLVKKGRQQTKKMAKKLRSLELHFDVILTSPLVRAKETATILEQEGLGKKAIEFPDLAPMGSFSNWLNWLSDCASRSASDRRTNSLEESIALVGHQPDLGRWAEILVWGSPKDNIDFKKSGIIGVRMPETGDIAGNCGLFWLTAPKYLLR